MIEDVLIIMPAFNEAAVIGETLAELRAAARHILVVDDGSTDETARIARQAGGRVLRLAANLKYGGALQAGFRYALRCTSFPFLVTFDADGQHDPSSLPTLLAPLRTGEVDYVVGSRFLSEARSPMSLPRSWGIRLFARGTSLLLGRTITDPTSGFTAFTREVAAVFLLDLYPQDFPDADVIIMLERMGFRLAEVPAPVRPARRKASMHAGILAPGYYLYKMTLSMLHLASRRDLKVKRKEARLAA